MVLADGVTALALRTTEALASHRQPQPVAAQIAAGSSALEYATFLSWRGFLDREPPRRPDPDPVAAPPAQRRAAWKFGLVAARCTRCGTRSLPPDRVCQQCHAVDEMVPEPLADVPATVTTYTVDRLAYTPSPPMLMVVLDFDGGGRMRCQLTDDGRGRGADRPAGGDDLPPDGHRRRSPQLLLEGAADPVRVREGRVMGSHGIKDQVAIVGMGCTAFGEHWDKSTDDLLVESATAAAASAGIGLADIDAFWLGTMGSGVSGLTLSKPLRLPYKPVTRLENMCATGSESLRNACYAVASGAYDCAMAIGVEKLKDSGFSGLAGSNAPGAGDDGKGETTAPANFSLLAPAYAEKYGVDAAEMKDVLTRIAWKNHQNGAKNPRAQFRKEVPKETISKSPLVAGMLGIFDCSGVSDGSAAAIVVRAEDALRYTAGRCT